MKRVRILIADDHPVVIEGLRRLLDRQHLEVVGEVGDGRALLKAAAELEPDVIITDVAMPLLNGIEAVRRLCRENRKAKVIFLTMHAEPVYAAEAVSAGGCGYVLKSSAGDELLVAIDMAMSGKVYIAKSIAGAVKRALDSRPKTQQNSPHTLTARQREVLQLLAEGRQVKEIAAALNVSPKTVEFHKYRIMDMLGLRTVAELARYAAREGVVG